MDRKQSAKPVNIRTLQITDDFWKREIELVRTAVLPYQWEALNDRIPHAQPSYCMHNYKTAAKLNRESRQNTEFKRPVRQERGFCVWPEDPENLGEQFYGFVFQDSDFTKWVEAAAYPLIQHPDLELERTIDEAIDIVCEAQLEDGYLDTYYILNDISKRFTNLKNNHELYCFGHLAEAGAAYYEATGKEKLLRAACRFADCIGRHFGTEEGKIPGYPGHELAEMALARLYEVTGEEKYLRLGKYFIDERGKRPYYFDREEPPKAEDADKLRDQYRQSHLPVREQEEAVGHAVRAVYLYAGMADFARLTEDESLTAACRRLWDDIVQRKMYITGGIGATHIGEAFSFAYDLPNDTAYAETCASVGMVFFARRMLELEADSRYADVMERELYNVVLSGMDLKGTCFFYVNPLEVVPEACQKDERKEHVKPVRQKWFGCACCPPNLARLIGSIGRYAVAETKDTLYVHLYMGCSFTKKTAEGEVSVDIRSGLPWKGWVSVSLKAKEPTVMTLALRIPVWGRDYRLKGAEAAEIRKEKGYLYLTKAWKDDTIEIGFPMDIQVIEADSRVREDIGKAAIVRGPVVYCMEEADNGKNLHLLKMNPEAGYQAVEEEICGKTVITISGQGKRQKEKESEELYTPYSPAEYEETILKWIPYYTWANRGEGEMQVWTRI